MRKIVLFSGAGLLILAIIFALLYSNREQRYPQATFPILNEAETQWFNAGIAHYRVVVEVEFASEHRRHITTVQNGQITEATISYWDGADWTPPVPISSDMAGDYIIPGLFSTLRVELNNNLREDLRVDMNADPAYPRYMYLGRVWIENEPMNESEARFTVTEFEILTSSGVGPP